MNYLEDQEIILEARDDEDDGLLNHGSNARRGIFRRKENPYYTDYKNQQIMKGKAIKTEKGWKKEQKRKKLLKMLIAAGGVAAAGKLYYNHKHPGAKSARKAANKIIARENKYTLKHDAKRQAKDIRAETKRKDKEASKIRKARNGSFWAKRWCDKHGISYEESINFLLENFNMNELQNYTAFNEGASREEWKYYRDQRRSKGLDYLPYKVWRSKKKKTKRRLILATLGAAAIASQTKAGKKVIRGTKDKILELKHDNRMYKSNYKAKNDSSKQSAKTARGFFHTMSEELSSFELNDLQHYYNEILTNEDFMKESYEKYKVMCESKGVTPISESVFSDAKEKLTSYSDAAIAAIKKKKKEKEEQIEKAKKEKEEKRKAEAKKEAEELKKMTPEQRKAYLRKKKKEELEEEEKEQDKRDLRQAAKTSFVRGGAEEAGHIAVKMASKMFMR